MRKIILPLFTFITFCAHSFAQTEEATTKSGKKVILNSDKTWKYVADEKTQTTNFVISDCSKYIETIEDKMTGKKTTAAKGTIIVSSDGGKKGFGIILMQSSSGFLIVSIQAVGAGSCIDQGNKINILFTDGTRLELSSDGKFNCKGNATLYFGDVFGKNKQLEELKTKKIQTMRVWTSESYVEQDFTEDNRNEFFHTINCLTTED